ncbi:hypothetical protein [Jiangella endophytica]|uniref:hypothetical protein n=1 Tax=Jiangella endophytica TaxID=1623398 RepID=UPI000E345DCC|nr:hypothetical protein [Jiangella endophytica]
MDRFAVAVLSAGGGLDGGHDAQVLGELVLDGGRTPVVWPEGAHWQAEPPAVVLPDGEAVSVGGAVNGSGGYLTRDQIALFHPGSTVESGLP